jgi:hypothetical protein
VGLLGDAGVDAIDADARLPQVVGEPGTIIDRQFPADVQQGLSCCRWRRQSTLVGETSVRGAVVSAFAVVTSLVQDVVVVWDTTQLARVPVRKSSATQSEAELTADPFSECDVDVKRLYFDGEP